MRPPGICTDLASDQTIWAVDQKAGSVLEGLPGESLVSTSPLGLDSRGITNPPRGREATADLTRSDVPKSRWGGGTAGNLPRDAEKSLLEGRVEYSSIKIWVSRDSS